ncbi:hypothetical protein MHF_0419 [Mycoplasma haemofelis Ohio2]|uniref:Uncharacterized protein n=1 Tax=Mycoplasma haemofelis (strain Ohio2) TaxID=859194 RepID=F6FH90_MYCHI|nr:hypothetical protein MHF_0419 [Mycoplasma haemofelis Ohio2]
MGMVAIPMFEKRMECDQARPEESMPKLPVIGSIVVVGGTAGVGGLAWESSKPSNKIALASNIKKPLSIKKCHLFSIVQTSNRTVKLEDESAFRKRVIDEEFWKKVDRDCGTKEKIYVAYRNQKWVYEEGDQTGTWNVTPS